MLFAPLAYQRYPAFLTGSSRARGYSPCSFSGWVQVLGEGLDRVEYECYAHCSHILIQSVSYTGSRRARMSLALLAGWIDPVRFRMAYQVRDEVTRPVRLLFDQVHFNDRL